MEREGSTPDHCETRTRTLHLLLILLKKLRISLARRRDLKRTMLAEAVLVSGGEDRALRVRARRRARALVLTRTGGGNQS